MDPVTHPGDFPVSAAAEPDVQVEEQGQGQEQGQPQTVLPPSEDGGVTTTPLLEVPPQGESTQSTPLFPPGGGGGVEGVEGAPPATDVAEAAAEFPTPALDLNSQLDTVQLPPGDQLVSQPPGDGLDTAHHSGTVSTASTEAMTAPVIVDTPVLSVADSSRAEGIDSKRQLSNLTEGGARLPQLDVRSEVSADDVRQMLSVLPVASLAPVPIAPPVEHQLELRALGQPEVSSQGTPSTPSTPGSDEMISPTLGGRRLGVPSFDDLRLRQDESLALLPPSLSEVPIPPPPPQPRISVVGTVPSVSELSKMSKQNIPPDCLQHVQGMLQRAKDRADPLVIPGSDTDNTNNSVLRLTEMEEQMGRSVLQQNEVTLREQIVAGMGQSSPRRPRKRTVEERKARAERKRQKELNRLAELKRLEIQRLQHPQQQSTHRPPSEMERIREANSRSITKQLQRDMKKFTPPFAGSPSDFLERGVTTSPHHMLDNHDVSYQQLAASLRRAYWVNKIDRDQQAAEDQFKRTQHKPSSPLQYLSRLDPTAAASMSQQPDFKTSLERFQFELAHGPSDDVDVTHELLAERRRRWR